MFVYAKWKKNEEKNIINRICSVTRAEGQGQRGKQYRLVPTFPNHQRWYAKWKLSRNMYTLYTFCMFGANLYMLNWHLLIKFLHQSRKFIKGPLLIGSI